MPDKEIQTLKNHRITPKLQGLFNNIAKVNDPATRIEYSVEEIDETSTNHQILRYISTKMATKMAAHPQVRWPPEVFMPHLLRCIARVSMDNQFGKLYNQFG